MRTMYCGHVNTSHIDQEIYLCGWAHRRRDHGGVIFIDLRDREGLAQVVIDPDTPEAFKIAETVRSEFVLRVKCTVRRRPEGTVNKNIPTGEVEMLVSEIEILNPSLTPPFVIDDDSITENIRLENRFMDLRRDEMQNNLKVRYQITKSVRKSLDADHFLEIETPILTRSTPEGARDYLVPSRIHHGEFFALPQSPQLFKQLLMISGFDRYFQIAKCFRDEDLRADRQPEFTQIDIEASFVEEEDIKNIASKLTQTVFKDVLNVDLPAKFQEITYKDAMLKYGSDKPDLRVSLELVELTSDMKDVDFKVFSNPANSDNGRVAALRIPSGSDMSRSEIDQYTEFVKIYGAKGLAYIKVNDITKLNEEGLQSPIVKNIHEKALKAIMEKTGAQNGDLIFFGADKTKIVNEALGALRQKVGHDRKILNDQAWSILWVVDFPLFEYSEEDQRLYARHHPFTSPKNELDMINHPLTAKANAYDIVLNGYEIGGGSIRIYKQELQQKMFEMLGLKKEEIAERFGFFTDALKYGTPPHGGIALGLDRLVMIMTQTENIKDVIAFPKTQSARDVMMDAPSSVDEKQLDDIHMKVKS